VHTTASGASEKIEIKYIATSVVRDTPREAGSIKDENVPPDIVRAVGHGNGVDGLGDVKEPDPDADVSSTTTPHHTSS
jgi:hypothetical protein